MLFEASVKKDHFLLKPLACEQLHISQICIWRAQCLRN